MTSVVPLPGSSGVSAEARKARPWRSRALVAGLCVLAVSVSAAFPSWPTYDSQYALLWGREIFEGGTPGLEDHRAPTPHPLLIAVGVLLSPLGYDTGSRLFMALIALSLVALIVAMYRLGRITVGVLGGLVAASLLVSRFDYGLLAAIGFLDIPYCALIAWATVAAFDRPRRDVRVLTLLTLAGLLRPEAWLLALAYAVWAGWKVDARRRFLLLAGAGAAGATWVAVDFAITGDPLFSFHHTDALAAELGRNRPLPALPVLMVGFIEEIVKFPVLAMAALGALLAFGLRNRSMILPAALVVLTCATYLVIAGGGLAAIHRYLLVAGLGVILFAGYALTGWTTLAPGTRLRRTWATSAILLVLMGTAYTVARTDPSGIVGELHEREALARELRAVLQSPGVAEARRCGPVTVPNHKLVPHVRAVLGSASDEVLARSDRSRVAPKAGVALVVDRRFDRHPALNVREVRKDGRRSVVAPAGFKPLTRSERFELWSRCA